MRKITFSNDQWEKTSLRRADVILLGVRVLYKKFWPYLGKNNSLIRIQIDAYWFDNDVFILYFTRGDGTMLGDSGYLLTELFINDEDLRKRRFEITHGLITKKEMFYFEEKYKEYKNSPLIPLSEFAS